MKKYLIAAFILLIIAFSSLAVVGYISIEQKKSTVDNYIDTIEFQENNIFKEGVNVITAGFTGENEFNIEGDSIFVKTDMAEENAGIDVLDKILAINGDDRPKPQTEFKKGHVTPHEVDIEVEETEDGFIIHMPGNYNVPAPSFYNGDLYVSGGFGSMEFYTFDATSGDQKWGIKLDDDGPSSPAIQDDIVVFNTESCTIFACDVNTGEQLWSYWLGDPLMSMPTIANDMVFTAYPASYSYGYAEEDGMRPTHVLVAFDLYTGDIVWQKWIDGDVMSAPVAEGRELHVSTFTGTLYKFNQSDGEILSAKAVRATSAPVISNDRVYLSRRSEAEGEEVSEAVATLTEDYTLSKQYNEKNAPYLDKNVQETTAMKEESMHMDAGNGFAGGAPASSGAFEASDNIGQSNVSSLQAFQGSRTLNYRGKNFNTMGDELVCTDEEGEKEYWRVELDGDLEKEGGFMGTPPISVGDKIIIATYTGDVIIYDVKSGKETERYSTGHIIRVQPIAMNGWIYVTSTTGKLIAINTGDEDITGWPTWGANNRRSNVVM